MQGSILGPHSFNIILLDSPPISSSRLKIADDNVIYKSCKKENIKDVLEEMINDVKVMADHFASCGLMLNYSKTKFMVIKNNSAVALPSQLSISNEINIMRVESHKFLGVTIDERFTYNEHVDILINKLTQSCRVLSIIKHHLPPK